jgi:precorrin-6Y C5,15-methyltransferase (decarboxylating)
MRVVINAVSLESITEVYNAINNYNVTNMDITQLNVSMAKKVGDYNLMQANNPVFIFSFDFC